MKKGRGYKTEKKSNLKRGVMHGTPDITANEKPKEMGIDKHR